MAAFIWDSGDIAQAATGCQSLEGGLQPRPKGSAPVHVGAISSVASDLGQVSSGEQVCFSPSAVPSNVLSLSSSHRCSQLLRGADMHRSGGLPAGSTMVS